MLSVFDHGAFRACPAPFNLAQHVLAAGAATPDKVALAVVSDAKAERWSYARLIAAVLGTGQGLLDNGLRPGDIVLMRLGNTVDFPIAYLGALAVGLVPVPSSPMLTQAETARIIAELSPAAILHDGVVACADSAVMRFGPETYQGWHGLDPAPYHLGDPARLGYVIYTSGTSGVPRAVGHAHRAIWARQMMMRGWYGLRPEDRLLHAGAFNWTFTLGTGLLDPWTMGATALIPAAGTDPAQLSGLLQRHEASLFAAAPGVYRKMMQAPVQDMPALRHGLAAGEKLSPDLRAAWDTATGVPIFEAFGMSECSTFISQPPDAPVQPTRLGVPQTGRRIAILGADGQPTPIGEAGVIAVHRDDPGLMRGYLGAPEATADKFSGDWFLTGDVAVMERDHQITYLGRRDDMMNAGGYRVSPAEVETALANCAGINEIAVTEVEIKADVRIIVGFYTAAKVLDDDMLRAHAQTRLAAYKCPKLYRRVPDLPRNANGKIQRNVLKAYDLKIARD